MEIIDKDFIIKFKKLSEDKWRRKVVNPGVYGFQFQKGTRWNPGLSETQIGQYEKELGFKFPPNLRLFISYLNGTDLPTLNVYGSGGKPNRTSVGVYSYPRDLESVKDRISNVEIDLKDIKKVLDEEGFNIDNAYLFPFYIHRYVVCDPNFPENPVLSIYGTDAIVYADNFRDYLEMEFLRDG